VKPGSALGASPGETQHLTKVSPTTAHDRPALTAIAVAPLSPGISIGVPWVVSRLVVVVVPPMVVLMKAATSFLTSQPLPLDDVPSPDAATPQQATWPSASNAQVSWLDTLAAMATAPATSARTGVFELVAVPSPSSP